MSWNFVMRAMSNFARISPLITWHCWLDLDILHSQRRDLLKIWCLAVNINGVHGKAIKSFQSLVYPNAACGWGLQRMHVRPECVVKAYQTF